MYAYYPETRNQHACIKNGIRVLAIFKTVKPTAAQGELMARALDPANVVVSRELLELIAHAGSASAQARAIDRLSEVLK